MKKKWIIAGSVIAACLVLYLGLGFFFESHFFIRSTVNGVSSSFMSPAGMKEKLTEEAKGYQLTLVEADGKKEVLTKEQLGMSVDIQEEKLQKMVNEQNGFLWGYYLFAGKEYQEETLIDCDIRVIKENVKKLNCVANKNPIETKDATVAYKGGEFVIVDEIYGTEMDKDSFSYKVKKAAISLQKELVLAEEACYKQPVYTKDSKEIKELKKQLNSYVNTEITYQIGSATEKISKETIASWLSVGKKCKPAFDQEAMMKFVKEMAKKYDTCGQPKQLNTQYGVAVTVPGGNYGWRLDKDKEVAQLMEDISAGKDVKRDFVYQYTAASRDGNDYGNSYVEINKTAQHLYLVVNGAVVMDTPMVTGVANSSHDTPVGAFRITYCQKNATLRGPGYVTPVSYWMPFNGDIGLHDAVWQKAFGGSRYREGYGSHGCVNLPLSAAGTIFSYVSAGFPVLMYDLPGTETVDTLARQSADACKNAIQSIGTVGLHSAAAIGAARGAYDALSDSAKSCVDNYQVLLDAEASYNAQKAQADALAQQQEAERQKAQAKAQGEAVVQQIASIGVVTDVSEEAIVKAEQAYAALSDMAKSYVTNYQVLLDARVTLNGLK